MAFFSGSKYTGCILIACVIIGLSFKVSGQSVPGLPRGFQLPPPDSATQSPMSGSGGRAMIDDSTKQIYGPMTTEYFFEDDILNNRDSARYNVDTAMTDFHRWTFVDKSWERLIDLGNLGTASREQFYQPRTEVGRQLGLRIFQPYSIDPKEVKYYDTHSPYTDMYYVLGGRDRELLRFAFTQNLTPRLNLGFQFQRFSSDKQFGTYTQSGNAQNLVKNWNFLFHGYFYSKDKKYLLLGHVRHLNHTAKEQGGVLPDSTVEPVDLFPYEGEARLDDQARSWQRNWTLRVYHQYRLLNGFQAFHVAELENNLNSYRDTMAAKGMAFNTYPTTGDTGVVQNIVFNRIDNTFGLKGEFSGFNYRAYLRSRLLFMNGTYRVNSRANDTYNNRRFETILGLWLKYHLKDSTWNLTATGEHLLGRDFNLKGEMQTPWARFGYQTIFTSPDMVMDEFQNKIIGWQNNFNLSGTNTIYGSFPIKTKALSFTPEIQYHLITNFLYYGANMAPSQAQGSFSLMRIGATLDLAINRWGLRLLGYYSAISRPDILRVPTGFLSAEVTFDFTYFKAMDVQLGLKGHYKTSYYADAYSPLIQQFYIQNHTMIDPYAVADAFVNLRIKRVRLLLKYSYLNKGLFGVPGFYITPGYLQLRSAFSFGCNWALYD